MYIYPSSYSTAGGCNRHIMTYSRYLVAPGAFLKAPADNVSVTLFPAP